MDDSDTWRIVLIGKTGAGKSNLGNTIFDEERFTVNHTLNSGTKECKAETKSVNGRNITLIDTPGFFDTDMPEEELKAEIVRCITECAPGPHAFLIVLEIEKMTKHEKDVIKKIQEYFSEEVFKYVTVVFTHGDQLPEGQTIEDYVRQNEFARDLVKKCGNRCHVVDNKYWNGRRENEYRSNKFQVKELLKTIEKTLQANKGMYYTNEMLQAVEEAVQQESRLIRQSSPYMHEKEIRQKAKVGVFKRFLIRLTGVGVGALLGALLGLAGAGMMIVGLIQSPVSIVLKAAGLSPTGIYIAGGACVAAGATRGGYTGYKAVEGAETLGEAAMMAAEAVKEDVIYVLDKAEEITKRMSKLHSD